MGLIELTGFGDLLRMVGVLFWLLVIGALVAAFAVPKTRNGKIVAVLVIVGLFAAFPGRWAWQKKQKYDAARARYETAEAMFQERCKKSGEFIHRTAENVEGILLMKVRPSGINRGDQYKMDDPYGRDLGGEGYIQSFARGFETRQAQFAPGSPNRFGYLYVDVINPKDGKRYRHTGRITEPWKTNPHALEGHRVFVLDKTLAPDPAPRYGVTYDDISTREERDYWIAGSSLKVIDLQTNEVMAERIGYMWDPGQGADSGGRAPWLMAADYSCPGFQRNPNSPISAGHGSSAQPMQTEDFVEMILKPRIEK